MLAAPVPYEEAARLAALHRLDMVGSAPDPEFDAIVQAASLVCGAPIALVSLVGAERQWFKAQIGLDGMDGTSRDIAFCAHTILGEGLLEVPDARDDPRFSGNPLVLGAPDIRFYAGAALQLFDGHRVGTLCVIDREPRSLDDKQRAILRSLAKVASVALDSWVAKRQQKQTEEMLVHKKHRMADLMLATNVGTWEWNLATGQLTLNGQYAEIFGWTIEELMPFCAEAAFAAVHPEDLAGLKAKLEAVLANRTRRYDHEFRMLHRDGRVIWIRGHGAVMMLSQDGDTEWIVGTVEDISQRKAQETALSKSEALLDQTGRMAGVGGWQLDLGTGGVAWSTEMFRIHGLPPGQTPTRDGALLFYPAEARPMVAAAMARAEAGAGGWDFEVPFVQAGGARLWVRSVGSTIFADGRAARLIGAIKDVTQHVAQRQALLAANERVTLATGTAGIGVWEWDPATDTLAWDDRLHALYGRTSAAPVTQFAQWLALVHPEDRARAASAARAAGEGGQDMDMEFRVVWADGTVRHLHSMARAQRDAQGRVLGMVGVNMDVTEARLMEAERAARERELLLVNAELERTARHLVRARDAADRASRAKSRFLAGMSHELRTPLNGILGYAQLLRLEGGLDATQSERVDAMLDAGRHLLDMISSVLELSEIETERVELRQVAVDVSKIAMASLDLMRPAAAAKGLRLNCCADMDAPKSVVTDQLRLRQIILNLLGNAVKFTDSGQVEVRLRAVPGETALRIEIADTGPGIKPDLRARLFQDFERLQADVTGMVEGAGLGLALSSRLAALLGGRMGHADNPGGGSIFWLELPLVLAAPDGLAAEDLVEAAAAWPMPVAALEASRGVAGGGMESGSGRSDPARLRILVVDDVAMNRDIACSFLRVAGHETACAGGGAEAVQAVLDGGFDVVLMDVQMPGVDGLEATRRIRQLGGAAGQVPIIGLTAQAFSEQILACTRAGMDGHLSKPYTPDALRAAMERAAALQRGSRLAVAVGGAALAVLDPEAVARMADYLTPAVIDTYLRSIVVRCEAVLAALRAADLRGGCDEGLAEALHTLAGSAGMFGFARLADRGVSLERALRRGAGDVPGLAADMVAAIEATLGELRCRAEPQAA